MTESYIIARSRLASQMMVISSRQLFVLAKMEMDVRGVCGREAARNSANVL